MLFKLLLIHYFFLLLSIVPKVSRYHLILQRDLHHIYLNQLHYYLLKVIVLVRLVHFEVRLDEVLYLGQVLLFHCHRVWQKNSNGFLFDVYIRIVNAIIGLFYFYDKSRFRIK